MLLVQNSLACNAHSLRHACVTAAFGVQFLRVHVLREYLDKEMRNANFDAAGGFDLERVIDDVVFMVSEAVGLWLCMGPEAAR